MIEQLNFTKSNVRKDKSILAIDWRIQIPYYYINQQAAGAYDAGLISGTYFSVVIPALFCIGGGIPP